MCYNGYLFICQHVIISMNWKILLSTPIKNLNTGWTRSQWMEIQSKLSQSSEAASWILWTTPITGNQLWQFWQSGVTKEELQLQSDLQLLFLLIITITLFALRMGKWTFQSFPQLPTTQYKKKEFVRESGFDVYVLGCLENTWAYFPLYISVLFVAEKSPKNKTFPTPFQKTPNNPNPPNWTLTKIPS